MVRTITPQILDAWLKTEKICVIDVREPEEYATECMTQSHLIPLSTITVDKLPTTTCPIVVHCQRGKRSAQACEKLLAENPNLDLYSLDGGINAWSEAGLQTQKGQKTASQPMNLDRQVQITAGSIIVTGVLLGYGVHPGFLGLAGFMGAGLIFAGISGSCRLKQLLNLMPWNKNQGKICL